MTDKIIEKYQNMLTDLPNVNKVKHVESKTSNITTSWGAQPWDELMVSRDILANFYDGCIEAKLSIDNVKISTKNDQIIVSSPKTKFALRKLFFLGSTKTEKEDMIGQHGEGYKMSVVSLARMSIYDPINISGSDALIVGVGNKCEETGLRPLIFHFFKINEQNGSYFIINTLSDKLKKAFEFGMLNFFHPKNKLVGSPLSEYNEIECYQSTSNDGVGFYRGLKRIDIKGIPIIINIKKPYAAIEKLSKMDRDRQAFSQKIQSNFFNIFCRSGFYSLASNVDVVHYILKSSKKTWKKGAPLLASLARHSYERLKNNPKLKKLFGKDYISESKFRYSTSITWSDWYSNSTQGYILRRDKAQRKTKTLLPSYFSAFGVESSLDAFLRNKENTEKRIKNKKTKDLSSKENKAIDFLFKASRSMSPGFAKLFNRENEEDNLYDVKFKKIFCKELLGELKNGNDYNSKIIYLHKDLFKSNFGRIFSIFLHELSHASSGGADGSREFSDCLTFLLEQSIEKNKKINQYAKEWNNYRV